MMIPEPKKRFRTEAMSKLLTALGDSDFGLGEMQDIAVDVLAELAEKNIRFGIRFVTQYELNKNLASLLNIFLVRAFIVANPKWPDLEAQYSKQPDQTCPCCYGRKNFVRNKQDGTTFTKDCQTCNATGKVTRVEYARFEGEDKMGLYAMLERSGGGFINLRKESETFRSKKKA